MAKNPKKDTEAFQFQVCILRSLSRGARTAEQARPRLIDEIIEESGIQDEREAQRVLYILEGHKLVTPHPAGDFTSRHWQITRDGFDALRMASAAAA